MNAHRTTLEMMCIPDMNSKQLHANLSTSNASDFIITLMAFIESIKSRVFLSSSEKMVLWISIFVQWRGLIGLVEAELNVWLNDFYCLEMGLVSCKNAAQACIKSFESDIFLEYSRDQQLELNPEFILTIESPCKDIIIRKFCL